jgi:uncharacterized protein (TIGR02284 family)
MLESKIDLKEETIEKLHKLIQVNIDSVQGFQAAADDIDDARVEALFRELAAERESFAEELGAYVEINEDVPTDDGSLMANIHRIWMNIRGSLSSDNTYAILAEAERGEDQIKAAYEDVLKDIPGSALNDVLQSQYTLVKSGHDQVRDLRDAFKNA